MSSFTKFFMVATATLMSTAQANACWFTGCFGGAPRTTFYAPIAPAPCAAPVATCNPCSTCSTCAAPTTVGYAPYTVGYAPYTAYRPTLFGGYRPYTAGYAPYTAGYAPAYTTYSAGYAPLSYSPVVQTSYYAPTTVLSPSCGCASPCSSCSTGTCNSCNTVPATTTFAPSSVTPTTYIQSTPPSGCSSCGVNSVTSTTPSNDNRYFTTPGTTTTTVSANTTFANTNAGTQFVTGSSEMRAVKSTNAQTPIAEETNRTEAPKSSVGSPLTPGRQYDPENKTTLKPIVNLNERFVEVPRISAISHTTAKPVAGDDWGR